MKRRELTAKGTWEGFEGRNKRGENNVIIISIFK